ncbi:guanylate kinase [bacterium]|nr:guanylate kinase [bacterium]
MSVIRTWSRHIRSEGLLIVLSGPSGVGKDAVLLELAKIYSNFSRCVTTTTRDPRQGEVDGIDYTFISEDEFQRRIDEGDFLEYANVHGNMYGTPRKWVEQRLSEGVDVILKIDVQGGLSVKKQMPSAVMVFLAPPSIEELEKRLRGRLTESENDLAKRLSNARGELDQIPHYEYIIENDSLAKAAQELKAVIIAEHLRVKQ